MPSQPWTAAAVRAWWLRRFSGVESPIKRGYVVWSLVGLAIAVPELSAAVGTPPWPTISGTVGHLEARWPIVAVIVVAALVVTAAQAVRLPIREKGTLAEQADESKLGRTPGGRVTCAPGVQEELSPWPYFIGALVLVVGGSFLASTLSDNKWVLGYVIYGLVAFFGIFVPSVLAYGPTPDAPFAGLFRTIADLEGRMHVVGLVLLAGLVVLLIHLAFYPWPDVFRHTPGVDSP